MNNPLSFDDVLIIPQFSNIISRKDVTVTSSFLGEDIFPVISSNMDTVTEWPMARAMAEYGARGCLHRFQSIQDNLEPFRQTGKPQYVSIGLGDGELERGAALFQAGATHFIIDVAHGANIEVVRQAKALRQIIKSNAMLVVGNFATAKSIEDFLYASNSVPHQHSPVQVDAVKLGIGSGAACTTRLVTGCGLPTLASILDVRQHYPSLKIIADGGIKTSGDLAKAFAAGANAVMIGKLLAGADEAPGTEYLGAKKYRGSASEESYAKQNKLSEWRTAEGAAYFVPATGPVKNTLQTLEAGLRSAMSYAGASTLEEFQQKARLTQITNLGLKESGAHGKI